MRPYILAETNWKAIKMLDVEVDIRSNISFRENKDRQRSTWILIYTLAYLICSSLILLKYGTGRL